MSIVTLLGLQLAGSDSATSSVTPVIGMASAQPTPAIGSNNDQEPLETPQRFLSAVFDRELGLCLLDINTPIDLTAIYSSRPNIPYPDGARSSQEPQTHSLAIRSRWGRRRWERRRER